MNHISDIKTTVETDYRGINNYLNNGWFLLAVGIESGGDQMRETVYQVSSVVYVVGSVKANDKLEDTTQD